MSKRTAQASQAIAEAWENECKLVREGKGTRDWTRDEQEDILATGKAHDENGKAFEGHHMQSVSYKPLYQGEAKNIQFLSRKEHLAAHGGSYQNPTNGFYDIKTNTTSFFSGDRFVPCEIIELTDSIMKPTIIVIGSKKIDETYEDNQSKTGKETSTKPENAASSNPMPQRSCNKVPSQATISQNLTNKKDSFFGWVSEKISDGIDAMRDWWADNGDIVKDVAKETGKKVGRFAVNHAPEMIGVAMSAGHHSSNNDSDDSDRRKLKSESNEQSHYSPSSDKTVVPDTPIYYEPAIPDTTITDDESAGTKRASPREHDVNDYDRKRFGKIEHVRKHRSPRPSNDENEG